MFIFSLLFLQINKLLLLLVDPAGYFLNKMSNLKIEFLFFSFLKPKDTSSNVHSKTYKYSIKYLK